MYQPLPEKLHYPDLEKEILAFWEEHEIFSQTLTARSESPIFSFFEGPPTVNGNPGIHHLMARTDKDLLCRYKTMTGHYVRRQAGWDTHGLPVEIAVEKQLGLVNKSEIEVMGIDKFNAKCREFVFSNIERDMGWGEFTNRMGFWVDMKSAYITCTNEYVESVWWALKSFFDKGLIYKGYKVVPQSPTIETPLSSHELSLGYREVKDPSVYLKIKILESPYPDAIGANILVWTTTPWTLFSNVALAVGSTIDYVLIEKESQDGVLERFIIADSLKSLLGEEPQIIAKFKGEDILGSVYEQLFSYCTIDRTEHPNALTILPGTFVSTEDGTGVVHIAPAFGVDDFELSKLFHLPILQPVTPNGHFTDQITDFAGRAIKTFKYADRVEDGADKDIIIALKQAGKMYKSAFDYVHSYPHCWRTDNPVMYYARNSWFIKSPSYKEKMIELNKTIRWQPSEIGTGRFGNWLEEVKDWSLSRDRYWGTPLPIWISEDKEDMFAVGSIEELKKGEYLLSDGSTVPIDEAPLPLDLHRPFVDNVIFHKNGKTYRRTTEVIDVWFDSGCVPFAQFHYPFENKELFEKQFPADFISEGIDQTRGWFYTLHNIATALFEKPAFKNIIVNELVLDKNGLKMSKSRGNTVDPFLMMDTYGADAVRWYFMVNNPPWRPTLFNEQDIAKTVIADFFRTITNTYSFYCLYANIDGINGTEAELPLENRPEIDRWIISKTHSTLKQYHLYMESYDVFRACRTIQEFMINDVSNWYVRRNRRRFWKGEKDADKVSAYQTLRTVLIHVLTMMAPAAPFLPEALYRKLRIDTEEPSIHMKIICQGEDSSIDINLERRMSLAQTIVFLARSLREKSKIKTRQPLKRILIPVISPQQRRDIQGVETIIKDELNIKSVEYVNEEAGIVKRSVKANFKALGKRYGKQTQRIANIISSMDEHQIRSFLQEQSYGFEVDNEEVLITMDDVEVMTQDMEGWLVANEGSLTVALDTEIDQELKQEGIAREFVNRLQNLRKTMGFQVTDRINVEFSANTEISDAIIKLSDYVCNEILCMNCTSVESITSNAHTIEIDQESLSVFITKIDR
jgi:isoleucyl-tRNA synthetase